MYKRQALSIANMYSGMSVMLSILLSIVSFPPVSLRILVGDTPQDVYKRQDISVVEIVPPSAATLQTILFISPLIKCHYSCKVAALGGTISTTDISHLSEYKRMLRAKERCV